MIEISLTQGKVALIDDEDFEAVRRFGRFWYAQECGREQTTWYAVTMTARPKRRAVLMHRVILGFPKSGIDHIDGNGLNNCKSNLRLATQAQQNMNRRKSNGYTSQYKGVCWDKKAKKWRTTVQNKFVGTYQDEAEAAIAYDNRVKEVFGEFARLNFP